MFFQEFSLVLLIKTNSSIFSFCFTFLMKLGEIVTFHCVEGVFLCRNSPIQPVCAPWLWWKGWIWYESHFFPGHAGSCLLSRRWSGNGGARAAASHEPGEVLAQDTTPPCWRSGHVSGCWSRSPEGQVWIGSFSSKWHLCPRVGTWWSWSQSRPLSTCCLHERQWRLSVPCSHAAGCPAPSRTTEPLPAAVLLTSCGYASQSKQGRSGGLAQADANAGLIAGNWPDSCALPVCFLCLFIPE